LYAVTAGLSCFATGSSGVTIGELPAPSAGRAVIAPIMQMMGRRFIFVRLSAPRAGVVVT
jgi:hypothetical protein